MDVAPGRAKPFSKAIATMERLLLCTDLDRTVLPNGLQEESPQARPLLRALARRPEVTLAYVSGRDLSLLQDAIRDYGLPVPDYAIGDVGTTIYEIGAPGWNPWAAWSREIAPDWRGLRREDLARVLHDVAGLTEQEPEKQNTFKLSYYARSDIDADTLAATIQGRLDRENVRAGVIWSVDETSEVGLVDILPASATKLHAIEFLMRQKGFDPAQTVFAGDSGNDLPVLTAGLQSVLVKNATETVRAEAVRRADAAGHGHRLYLAEGGFLGMNGNYAAGVLEGLSHFIPEVEPCLREALQGLAAPA